MGTMRNKILITGASSGLGEEMAKRFAAQGKDLALCARRLDRLEALRDELIVANPGVTVAVRALDVTDHDAVGRVFGELHDELGGLDRVVVNAGLGKGAKIGTGRADANLATARTNFVGALSQIEAALEIFRKQKFGHLVLVSSVSADRGLPGPKAVYSASKAGVAALGDALATELSGTDIVVTTLLPGFIETDMSAKAGDKSVLTASLDQGVTAMISAIEKEPRRAALPGLKWRGIDVALRFLPNRITDRLV
ncbi:MAG: SDR family oxidoreductase [Rhodococcus fascians]|uniref:SDR family oxidoreductase n=1 Tax=Nocardiaceae TaxID=85025 RepID=UPI000377883E|nr:MULTISPECIES: SDR family oxidoreductase [Rhodococcus]OZC55318.1 short-chain dehydrogenase [Rhodococcus sp. 06-621-2]OZC88197.1 short-chain dehydrogenase [Rhodococcus sp. 06-418-1B]OZD11768.1 short-chain dehydrogenase [Rhodococcus sp. 06-156-4C]OZD15612.1 short-chain dehydrogenase [Rhodococcus sp. 06-156-4a]OZD23778.1 short-chain dehydrogenase [Rhodococcus sp. 06-156-3C]